MKQSDNKIIDWDLSVKLADNNPKLARKLLQMYLEALQELKPYLQKSLENSDYSQLKEEIHRLRGASCYVGVPKIKHLTAQLEAQIATNNSQATATNLAKLITAIDAYETDFPLFK